MRRRIVLLFELPYDIVFRAEEFFRYIVDRYARDDRLLPLARTLGHGHSHLLRS